MRYTILVFSLYVSCIHGQTINNNNLEIKITIDSLEILKESSLILPIRVKNNTDFDLLLYGLDSKLLHNGEMDQLCNIERTGGGLGIFIYDGQNKRKYSIRSIVDSINSEPMTRALFEDRMKQAKEKYLRGTKVAIKSDFSLFERKIDLSQYTLKKGMYFLQAIYYSGVGIKDNYVVGEEQVEKDRQFYNAELYQGCAVSNRIVFWVR